MVMLSNDSAVSLVFEGLIVNSIKLLGKHCGVRVLGLGCLGICNLLGPVQGPQGWGNC